uniref:substrate-binding periplasmic protein n=1 Tax=uncultured Draconibacterium sp. TaxID=1573823 RepID=UPI0032167C6C
MNSCTDDPVEKPESITISGIEFSPNYFTLDGKISGIDADMANLVMGNAGIDRELTMEESWTEAYNNTLAGPDRALLTCGYSAERKDLFKWAGPTSKGGYYIFSKVATGIGTAIGLQKAKEISSIAVVKDWLETTSLEDLGFNNLVYFDSYEEAITALLNNDVDAMASDVSQFGYRLNSEYNVPTEFDICYSYRNVYYYIAFSKDVDDHIVDACQKSIDAIVKTQQPLEILKKYLPNASPVQLPGQLQIFTEQAPPFNFYTGSIYNYELKGSSIDIVNEIQSRNGFVNNINLTSWGDAYKAVQYLPNSALFTTARTPEREDLFQWVGPISSMKACFYTMSESGIQITSLEDAKSLASIATPSGWYMHDYLTANGFQNIVATSFSPVEAFNQLVSGQVEALFMFNEGIDWLCEVTETSANSIIKQYEVSESKGYIAFSQNTSQEIVEQWQNNLDAMKADGTFETIWNKWYEGLDMP